MSRVFANKATICTRLIRQAFPSLLSQPASPQVEGERTLNRCGKHLHLGKRLRADLPLDERDPLVLPGAPHGDRSNKKSPRLPVSRHSSCVCAGPAERRVEAEMLVAVMCVGRNAPVLSLRPSYARMVRWKPLPGTVCRASASLSTG